MFVYERTQRKQYDVNIGKIIRNKRESKQVARVYVPLGGWDLNSDYQALRGSPAANNCIDINALSSR